MSLPVFRSFSVGDVVCVRVNFKYSEPKLNVYEVVSVCLGGLNQTNCIGLKPLSQIPNSFGGNEMYVPEEFFANPLVTVITLRRDDLEVTL